VSLVELVRLLFLCVLRHTRLTRVPYTTLFRSQAGASRFVEAEPGRPRRRARRLRTPGTGDRHDGRMGVEQSRQGELLGRGAQPGDRKSTRLNSSHGSISYAGFWLQTKTETQAG